MSIAYCVMAHHKPNQLLRLLKAIYHPDNYYMIHVDLDAPEMIDMTKQLARDNHNIYVLPSRKGVWGGWSLVQIELEAIRELLQMGENWTHYISLSGQDFPLISQTLLLDICEKNPGTSFMEYKEQLDGEKSFRNNAIYGVQNGIVQAVKPREIPFEHSFPGMKLYTGSQWKVLSRSAVEFANSSDFSFALQNYMAETLIPDETFFQTLIGNNIECFDVRQEHKWAMKLVQHATREDSQLLLWSPRIITIQDVMSIMSGPHWFARKFDEQVDSLVLDVIEKAVGSPA